MAEKPPREGLLRVDGKYSRGSTSLWRVSRFSFCLPFETVAVVWATKKDGAFWWGAPCLDYIAAVLHLLSKHQAGANSSGAQKAIAWRPCQLLVSVFNRLAQKLLWCT